MNVFIGNAPLFTFLSGIGPYIEDPLTPMISTYKERKYPRPWKPRFIAILTLAGAFLFPETCDTIGS